MIHPQLLRRAAAATAGLVLLCLLSLSGRGAGPEHAGEVPPKLLKAVEPEYPVVMRASGSEGEVAVEFIVDPTGRPTQPFVVRSSDPRFERPALDAVVQWRFAPARIGERAVAARVQQTITFHLEGGDEVPKLLKAVEPEYPVVMRASGLEGEVTVEFIVDATGRPTQPFVLESNNPWFERPALDAVLKWRFAPARIGERAVAARVQQKITFHLDGGGEALWRIVKTRNHESLPLEFRWDEAPEPIATTYPVYPAAALLEERSGQAKVRYMVDAQGAIMLAEVFESSAPEFTGAVQAAVDGWRFKPARRKGVPCQAVVVTEFKFRPRPRDGSVPVTASCLGLADRLRRGRKPVAGLGELDGVPRALSRRPPVFPRELRAAGQPGEALIEFYIDAAGDAQLPRVVSASAPEYGYAAAQAVAAWRFERPLQQGKPVVARVQIPISFALAARDAAEAGP